MGGNAFATEFFKKSGGSNLLTLQDGKQKYTSRVAELYKEELERRILDDEKRSVFAPWPFFPLLRAPCPSRRSGLTLRSLLSGSASSSLSRA